MEDVGVFSRRVSRMHLLMARIALALYMPNGPYYGFAMVSESPLGRATIGSTSSEFELRLLYE